MSAQSKCLTFKALFLEKGNRVGEKKLLAGVQQNMQNNPKSMILCEIKSKPGSSFVFFFLVLLCEILGSPENNSPAEWVTVLGDRNESRFSLGGLKSSVRDRIVWRVLLQQLKTTVRLIFDGSVWGISQHNSAKSVAELCMAFCKRVDGLSIWKLGIFSMLLIPTVF